jgi:hypothetical protein
MIVWIARGFTRLVALIALPLIAFAALALAVATAAGSGLTRDAAQSIGLTDAWRTVGDALDGGRIDAQSLAIGGAIALVAGLLLLVGSIVPRKERDRPLPGDATLAIRRRAQRQADAHLASGAPHAEGVRTRQSHRRSLLGRSRKAVLR